MRNCCTVRLVHPCRVSRKMPNGSSSNSGDSTSNLVMRFTMFAAAPVRHQRSDRHCHVLRRLNTSIYCRVFHFTRHLLLPHNHRAYCSRRFREVTSRVTRESRLRHLLVGSRRIPQFTSRPASRSRTPVNCPYLQRRLLRSGYRRHRHSHRSETCLHD